MAFQKKTTAAVETVLGSAAASIKKSVVELSTAISTLSALENTLDEKQIQIAAKEDQLKALDVEFAEKKRQAQVQLELDMKQSTQSTVDKFLASIGLVSIAQNVIDETAKELADLKTNFATKVREETGAVAAKFARDADHKEKLLAAEYNAKEAENKAKISQLEQQITFLVSQVSLWKTSLDDERKASTERAKAGAVGTINLGQQGNSR